MSYLKIIFLLLVSINLYANIININEQTKSIEILPNSEIYIDKNRNLTIEDIIKQNVKFEKNNKEILSFGYSPDFDVWIKIVLKNDLNKPIKKILEYNNPLTTNVDFYDVNKNNYFQKDGLLTQNKDKYVINPIFEIELNPNEEKVYFVKASSYITTLIIDLKLWNENSFYQKEIKHQIILSLFFGAMFILGIYNLFIYLFTRDKSYLYYVIYIFGLIAHHLVYVGFTKLYMFNSKILLDILELSSVLVALPVYALGLFTKSFLQTNQYPILNKILNGFLIVIPISILFFIFTDDYDKYRNSLTMLFLLFLMIVTIYGAIKRNKQAYFILFGWFIFLSSGMLMFLSSSGVFDIKKFFPLFNRNFICNGSNNFFNCFGK
ncbi:7TM diverse intracellular signaling domain-containing protein [Arcobacter sp. L]|uniref:7TMR-DISM family protein n=1 Tax=Arcobacter sp. L TaxID=944547 RepID=UPI0002295DCB|nr:7TM diverse intracellular signaling domain-containing protein [Arcobacter sp. L]BAK73287.1 two-component sensor kinase [Arcobacter sp. L]